MSFVLTTIAALAVYCWTLAPEVTLEFSGTLSTSAKYAGVAHPPGFPVWTLYSWLFANLLPFSNVAARVALGSAVAGALACGLVALMVSRAGSLLLENMPAFTRHAPADQDLLRVVCGFVAGTVLGLSRPVWRVAVIVETWALSLLLFTLIFGLLLRWIATPQRKRFLYAACFVFGLLLTSNQEFIVIIPALLVFVLAGDRALGRDLSLVVLLLVFTVWAVGALDLDVRLNLLVSSNLRWIGAFLMLDMVAVVVLSWTLRTGLRWIALLLLALFLVVVDFTVSTVGISGWFGAYLTGNVGLLTAFSLIGALAVVEVVRTRRVGSKQLPMVLCVFLFLLGFGAYFYLPIASMTEPPVNWGYARTVEGFFHLITRGQYERFYPTRELSRFTMQLWLLAKETWKGFGWPCLPLLPLPFFLLRRANRCPRAWLIGMIVVLVCVGPLMLELLNPSAERAAFEVVNPYWGALNVILAIWAGLGFMVVGSVIPSPRVRPLPADTGSG